MKLEQIINAHYPDEWGDPRTHCLCGWESTAQEQGDADMEWAAHVAAEIRKARTVTTVEELDALPQGALIEHQGAVYRNRKFINLWQEVDWQRLNHDAAALLPARILWHSEADT